MSRYMVFDGTRRAASQREAMSGLASDRLAIEHVLDAIGGIEDAGENAAAGALEGAEEHGFALLLDELAWARNASSSMAPSFSAQVSSAMPRVAKEPSSLAR